MMERRQGDDEYGWNKVGYYRQYTNGLHLCGDKTSHLEGTKIFLRVGRVNLCKYFLAFSQGRSPLVKNPRVMKATNCGEKLGCGISQGTLDASN